jgi:hypothetical protein
MASNNPNFKTSVCKYAYVGCKQQNRCWYAHNKNELRQRYCINGNKCSDQTCCYLHPNQSVDKDEYYLKVLFKSDVLGIDKNIIKRHIDDKFVIEIDNEDYESDEDEDEDNNEIVNTINTTNNEKLNSDNVIDDDNSMEIDDFNDYNNDDLNLKNHIDEFTSMWNTSPESFYEMKDDKIWKCINIKVNELQLEHILKCFQNSNIEFNFEK